MPFTPNKETPGSLGTGSCTRLLNKSLKTDVAAQMANRREAGGPGGAVLADRGHVLRRESN
ncbi:hypothetical protein EYF80_034826 [Liparis tanakae]|uniref:Uncharacterized protein n=1 Tax=Liparis tanakae TaxID=230148 RepID=A0A4Z2GMV8_9TELE|nr:hypothetical protein EYF80_034826 [Liparis tanakae]